MVYSVRKYGDIAISENQALEVLKSLQNHLSNDAEAAQYGEKFCEPEIKRPGEDRKIIIASPKKFFRHHASAPDGDDSKKEMFYEAITTTDRVACSLTPSAM
jgi:hypothetical protein